MTRTATTVVIATIVVTSWVAAQRPIRVGVDLVHFGIVVTDRQGAPVPAYRIDDFEVLEHGKPQAVKFFAPADAASSPVLHLGFLLDVSGSMAEDIKDVRTAAIKFLNQNERAVDVTLVDFDLEVRVRDSETMITRDLIERIISTCTPSSTTRSAGRRKKAVARCAFLAISTKMRSRHMAMPGRSVTRMVSRPRK